MMMMGSCDDVVAIVLKRKKMVSKKANTFILLDSWPYRLRNAWSGTMPGKRLTAACLCETSH